MSATAEAKIVEIVTFKLPDQLARHVWRLMCTHDELRRRSVSGTKNGAGRTKGAGASESGLVEVALEGFLSLSLDENSSLLQRTYSWRGVSVEYRRKSYSLPNDLLTRWSSRVNLLKDRARSQRVRISQWLCVEAALIYLVELAPETLAAELTHYDVRKKRA